MEQAIIRIEVRASRSHGLEVFKVYVNGTYVTEYLSVQLAQTKVMMLKNKLQAA